MKTYEYLLQNLETLSNETIDALLLEVELETLGEFLKRKFSDKRSPYDLASVIRHEYRLV